MVSSGQAIRELLGTLFSVMKIKETILEFHTQKPVVNLAFLIVTRHYI